ncbi:MAG: zinc/cadmium/mercury/lead-transporting ATPase, partial [Aeromonas sp.]
MSKSCCNHAHAAPIKAISKAASHQSEHQHDSHCCDNAAPVSGCTSQAPHDHQAHGESDPPGDEEPPRGSCSGQACCSAQPQVPDHAHDHVHQDAHGHHDHDESPDQ